MWYRCKACGHEEARGLIPAASCGLYFFVIAGIGLGVILLAIHFLKRAATALHAQTTQPVQVGATPWWLWVILVPASIVFLVLLTVAMNWFLELLEYLAYAGRKCPKCGKRKWSWGFTKGFGL